MHAGITSNDRAVAGADEMVRELKQFTTAQACAEIRRREYKTNVFSHTLRLCYL